MFPGTGAAGAAPVRSYQLRREALPSAVDPVTAASASFSLQTQEGGSHRIPANRGANGEAATMACHAPCDQLRLPEQKGTMEEEVVVRARSYRSSFTRATSLSLVSS